MKIVFPKECQKYIDLQCNGDLSLYEEFPEHKHLMKYLEKIDPAFIMDIGAGLGRASVWIAKKMGWESKKFLLIDGNRGEKQYDEIRKNKGEYYNNWWAAYNFCWANGLQSVTCFGPEEKEEILEYSDGGKIDLVYSFLAIAFHWPLDFYLNDIYPLLADKCLLAFGMRGVEKKKWCMKQVKSIDPKKYKILELILKEKSSYESLLVLERK